MGYPKETGLTFGIHLKSDEKFLRALNGQEQGHVWAETGNYNVVPEGGRVPVGEVRS